VSRVVVKMGGHALDDLSPSSEVVRALGEDLAVLARDGTEVVVVHGGGPQIAELLARVGLSSAFHEGLRITSPETMTYVAMALSSVNTSLVAALTQGGLTCAGLDGADGRLFVGRSLGPPWDRAATVAHVDTLMLECLWRGGVVPVVSPVGLDEAGALLNCNADVVAGALAGAIKADTLVLLSDIDQLRATPDDPATALTHVSVAQVATMIRDGAARDGMRPKMSAAVDALAAGARRVVLANGTRRHAVRDVLNGQSRTTEVVA